MGGTLSHPIVNLSSKVAVITGGNAGIGYETAKALAVMGAHTIIASRSEEKTTAVSSWCIIIIYHLTRLNTFLIRVFGNVMVILIIGF